MEWISVQDELPIQKWQVLVKNGKRIYYAHYYRKKWYGGVGRLKKVTHWNKNPETYPKISPKDLIGFFNRCKKYRNQMQTKTMRAGPIIGLI